MALLLVTSSLALKSQEEGAELKKVDHYISLQVNELLRQLVNISSAPSVTSPFFLNYSINSTNSGFGGNAGFGYSVSEETSGDELNSLETKNQNMALRIGGEQKVMIGKKWMISYGLDFVSISDKNETTSIIKNTFGDEFITETENSSRSQGGGLRGGLYFFITPRILIGTETTYYQITINETNKVRSEANGIVQESEDSPKTTNVAFTPPAVIWLSIKF